MSGPVLLCYDGSDSAKHAIAAAPALVRGDAWQVLIAWQPLRSMSTFAWGAPMDPGTLDAINRSAREGADALAAEGVDVARRAGLEADAYLIEAVGPVWAAIVDAAEDLDAAAIVVGSRGLTGLRNVVLGSVSEGVVRHAGRPVVVVHGPPADGG
jgi:nucleotide-binding universal stress UspA family protein